MTQIVIVEDEPSISEVVSLYLNRAGFEVTTFSDGLSAFDHFAKKLPDLVILDVMLPGMDGFSVNKKHSRSLGCASDLADFKA